MKATQMNIEFFQAESDVFFEYFNLYDMEGFLYEISTYNMGGEL